MSHKLRFSMVKIKLKLFLSLFIFFLLSCGRLSEITVGDVDNIIVKGFEDNSLLISADISVNNPARNKITIIGFDTRVYLNDQFLGKINSVEHIVIHSKSSEKYTILFNVRLSNILGTAFAMMNLKEGNKINVKVEGVITARSLLIKRKINVSESRVLLL
jgi:LEA14-like dessication related protein